jgi:hypothetical protein
MMVEAILPDGRSEVVSYVKDFNFNWMTNYIYEEDAAPVYPKGTVIHVTAYYDNTRANKSNPDPDQWVGYGDRTVDEMVHQRLGDWEAFKEYQRAVFDRTEAHLAAIDPADLTRVLIAPPYPPQVASTYSARCAGPQGITVLDGFECWHYQHGLRHMGEIELARGLVGLGGMTS